MKLFILKPGQPREVRELGKIAFGYDNIKKIVEPLLGGQGLEHVSVLFEQRRADMFVGENSANNGSPVNPDATTIYQAYAVSRGEKPADLPSIYGPAVIFEKLVWR